MYCTQLINFGDFSLFIMSFQVHTDTVGLTTGATCEVHHITGKYGHLVLSLMTMFNYCMCALLAVYHIIYTISSHHLYIC